MNNIKAAFVNYYGHNADINDGMRIPLMIRIAGSVDKEEHLGAT